MDKHLMDFLKALGSIFVFGGFARAMSFVVIVIAIVPLVPPLGPGGHALDHNNVTKRV